MSYKERIDRLDETALLKALGLSGTSILGVTTPDFGQGVVVGTGESQGVVGGPGWVVKYYYILCTESIFESDDL